MNDNEKRLLALSCFLGGVVAGFLLAPIKKGICCGNNCGNHVSNAEDLKKMGESNLQEYEIND
ncbi:hypothetical protein [Clostridium nigeriense]|uniref:hypothetical protein n=1 Tax=Clostridium nigeriense TaxID=1805470 RepID=UPI000835C6D1|nr:hypothetical protein [Clostridium nigeriense]